MALVMAPACAACRAVLDEPLAGPVCGSCWSAVRTCTLEWRHDGEALRRVVSAGPYDGTLRDIIHAWKFEGRQGLARPLAHLVRLHCGEALNGADVAVPVPITPWRHWQRGFNQADDLARHLGVPRARALARWRPRAAQSTLPAAARRRNVDTSMFVPAWRRAAVRDRVIVLVDDVVTTGATLEACARVLHAAGAKEVRAVTVAQTVLRGGAVLKRAR
ncbi:MAG: ComF family protein [Vicinamibacterales bacterium]